MKRFTIGPVSRILGLSPETLRNIERRGIFVPERDWSGRRVFSEKDIEELQSRIFPKKDHHESTQ